MNLAAISTKKLKKRCSRKNTPWLLRALSFIVVICVFSMCRQSSGPVLVLNPYEKVNWEEATQHKANFHAHTTETDGRYPPHEVVDQYHQMGYTILAITDHDRVVYPWTGFSDLNADYENRDPNDMGMLAIMGNELSRHHHTLSLFTDFKAESRDLNVVLENQADHSDLALAVLAHPAMHWPRKFNIDGGLTDSVITHYTNYFNRHNHLIGMEVHNGTRPMTEYTLDRALWDSLLVKLMPHRPVWGFATDDIHRSVHYGRDWLVLPLSDLSTETLRNALISGSYYFSSIRLHKGNDPDKALTPRIESITHNRRKGFIRIEVNTSEGIIADESIQWISNGAVIHTGQEFPYKRASELGNYVRAEIIGEGGTTYTNPFGFKN